MRGRRVVAVVAHACDSYQSGIAETIRTRLAAAGYGTLCLAGHDHDAFAGGTEGIRHPLAGRVDVRGSIVMSGIIGREHPAAALAPFARDLGPGPVVSLGIAVPDVPSITLEAGPALDELMTHMTRDPRRRRFAFVRGYGNGPDSRERERAFRAGLAARGLEVDEALFFEGRFTTADAYAALDAALADGLRVDGVVAANDAMAASAVMALERHGLTVPQDVIVSGFDGSPIATELQPPLTTVHQRIDEQALAAAELLLGALESGEPLDPATRITLEAELLLRDSTRPEAVRSEEEVSGDTRADRGGLPEDAPLAAALRAEEPAEALHRLLVRRLGRVTAPEHVDADAVADVFVARLTEREGGPSLRSLLERSPMKGRDTHWWQHARRQLVCLAERLPEATPTRDDAIALTLSRLDGALAAARTRERLEQFSRRQLHERLLLRLAACSTEDAVWTLLRQGLRALGVTRAWVLMHETSPRPRRAECDAGGEAAPPLARLRFALDGTVPPDPDDAHPFAAILPPRLEAELERDLLVLVPLHDGEREIGALLLEPLEGGVLELDAIAASLAQALRQVRQMADLEHRAAELHRANDALTTLARYDSLTGLPNRALFHECLARAILTAREKGDEVALLFFDLDGFKLINDTLGHGAGDELLGIVANRVRHVLRDADVLARLGGDEFTIIAPQHVGERGAQRIATDVLATIARPYRLGERVVDVSASIGIAVFPGDGEDAETLLRNADTAMYHAKATGKDRHAFYAPVLNTEAMARLELHEDMRRALADDEFHMHYQPRVELASGRLTAFEALMRWTRRGTEPIDDRPVGPDRFIPVAEECGLIGVLDAFALDTVCRQGRAWLEAGSEIPIAVNLSVRRLQEHDIVEQVLDALARHALPAELLELEITESAAMTDVEGNIGKLGALREAGVRVAIDDFGTGYSSLNYLKRLPVSSLKIDRSFLGDIGGADADEESPDAAIVRAVIALGRSMRFRLVAEGVENEAQLAFLLELGCDEGQGYLFDRALDVRGANARLGARGRDRTRRPATEG